MAIACSFLLGLYQIIIKKSVARNAAFPVTLLSTLFASLPVFLLFVLSRLPAESNAPLIPPSPVFHAVILGKSVVVCASWVLGFKAIQQLPLSIASPLRESGLAWTLFGGILLFNERLSGAQFASIVFFFLAVAAFSTRKSGEESKSGYGRIWVLVMLVATTCGAVSSLMDKHILTNMNVTPLVLQCWFGIYNLLVLTLTGLLLFRSSFAGFRMQKRIVFCGLVLFLADLLYYHSVHSEGAMISIISLIRRISFVSPVLFGLFFLKERLSPLKALSLTAVFLAVILAVL